MTANTILVLPLATPLAAAHNLVQHIRCFPAPAALDEDDTTWGIENRYYTAQVQFSTLDTPESTLDEQAPAVIVLLPHSATPPALLGTTLARFAAREPEFEVALVVMLSSGTEEIVDENAWEDIAMEYGFEWVSLGDSTERGERESTGLARVVEALQSHLWESMVRKGKENQRSNGVDDTGRKSLAQMEEEEEASLGAPPLPTPRPFVPTPLAFPSTFLPSIVHPKSPAFEDDFAPFVPISSSFPSHPAFSELTPPVARVTDAPPLPATLNFTAANHFLRLDSDSDDEGADDAMTARAVDTETLVNLLGQSRLDGLRAQAEGLDVEGKRRLAEQVLHELL